MSTTLNETSVRTGPLDPVGTDLMRTMKALKLGGLAHTLPERLALARQHKMGHAAFLQLLLSDEVTRATPAPRACGPPRPAWTPRCAWTPGTSWTTSPTTGPCCRT